ALRKAPLLRGNRVPLAPVLEQLGRHIAHVIVRGVAMHSHRQRFDQRRPAAVERALARSQRGREDRLDVVAVDDLTRDTACGSTLYWIDRVLEADGRRVRVLVV